LTKKAKLDFDKKKLDVEKKIKKENTASNTVLTPTRRQKPAHKAQRRRVCVSTTVR
jgi:hypothetical protein